MRRFLSILLALLLVTGLASCTFLDDVLKVNIFAESIELSVSEVQQLDIRELLEQSDSKAYMAAIKSSAAVKNAVLEKALAVIEDPSASARAVQEAGILGARVLINTSPAGELLANVITLADGLPETPTMEDLLDRIMPESVYAGSGQIAEAPFVSMINALVDADVYYRAIGENLEADYLATAVSPGDIAIGAFFAAVITGIEVPGGYTTVGDYLYAALTDEEVSPPDFESPDTDSGYLANILDAASLGSLLDL